MKKSGGIKIIMIAAIALIILAGTGAAVSLSNSGGGMWKYQHEISIKENSGTTLTDYQVLIELKGADFPSEAKSDGADVRFTDSSGNELNYWIESWDYTGKSAKVWVKVPSVPAGSITVILMYYGNPSASSLSNGDETFEFFDDFTGDLSKWTYVQGAMPIIENGEANIIDDGIVPAFTRSKLFRAKNGVIEAKVKIMSSEIAHWQLIGRWTSMSSLEQIAGRMVLNDFYIYDGNPEHRISNPVSWTSHALNTWFLLQFKMNEDSLEGAVYDEIGTLLASTKATSVRGIGYIGMGSWKGSHTHYDYIRVRKYASSEPTVSLAPPKSSSLSITKSASPYSLRQFQESTIKVLIENSGTSEVKAIEIMDSIHPSFDLTGGDFPNPKKFDIIRAGESRELQYTIKSKESGAFMLDPATVTYADSEGNIQEVKSEPVSIKVVPSSDGGSSGTNTGQNSRSASVSLHGEKTDVVMGEDILLRLSAVNLITKPKMHVQVIIIPPSGMSVTSSEFSKSAAGQFTANYQLEPGDGKDIEVRIRSNQVGDFNVNGRIIYYFGDDKEKAEDQTLNLPIKVRAKYNVEMTTAAPQSDKQNTPGFAFLVGLLGLVVAMRFIKRK